MQKEIPRNAREKSPELHRAIESVTEPLYPFGLDETEREGTEEMLTMSRIDEIRRAYFEEGKTISGISAEYALDRKTVRKYVMKEDFNAVVPSVGREAMQPKLDPYKKTIDEWLEGDMKARRKQRHTAKRVYDRLVETHAGNGCLLDRQCYRVEKCATSPGKNDPFSLHLFSALSIPLATRLV